MHITTHTYVYDVLCLFGPILSSKFNEWSVYGKFDKFELLSQNKTVARIYLFAYKTPNQIHICILVMRCIHAGQQINELYKNDLLNRWVLTTFFDQSDKTYF